MSAPVRKAVRGLAALLAAALLSPMADARPVRVWTMKEAADKADVLVTGEVLAVSRGRTLEPDETRWHAPILQMHARIRVLRSFARPGKPDIPKGCEISLAYSAVDWQKGTVIVNGPSFPRLHVGNVFVFPLRATAEGAAWELIDEEDHGLLVPSARDPLPNGRVKTGVDFLHSELAAAFCRGTYEDIHRGARYVRWLHRVEDLDAVYALIRTHTGDDQERWLSITTASYCAMALQRPKIAELLRDAERAEPHRLLERLTAKALAHLRPERLDDRLIAHAIRHADVHNWGTAVTIIKNYPRHPTAMRLLREALKDARPGAVYIAQYIIKEKDHPLLADAIEASRKLLLRRGESEAATLRPACLLIREYGDEASLALLLDEIRQAQKADRKRYGALFQSCADSNSPRMIGLPPACQVMNGLTRPAVAMPPRNP